MEFDLSVTLCSPKQEEDGALSSIHAKRETIVRVLQVISAYQGD